MSSLVRSRWAAVGAAVAISLGAGGIGIGQAVTDSGDKPVFVPIEPCRLAFTTPGEFQVGPRTAPLGPGEIETFDGWGVVGDCDLPEGTSGLALNVTALDATELTNLRFFPADADEVPTAANLNPAPGQPPTPNAVDVDLDDSGQFNVFNAFGNVAIVIDVAGYYDDHHHDDRYYTRAQTDDQFGMQWLIIGAATEIRSASPGLEETTIFRPPSEPDGIYCLVFPDGVSFNRHAIVGTIEDYFTGVQDWGISINSTLNTECSEDGAQWNITVKTTEGGAYADAGFRLLIPPN